MISQDRPGGWKDVGLVYSPALTCNCQQTCDQLNATGCHVLNSTIVSGTSSFRFQGVGDPVTACMSDTPGHGGHDNC